MYALIPPLFLKKKKKVFNFNSWHFSSWTLPSSHVEVLEVTEWAIFCLSSGPLLCFPLCLEQALLVCAAHTHPSFQLRGHFIWETFSDPLSNPRSELDVPPCYLLQHPMHLYSEVYCPSVSKSCLTFCNPKDSGLPCPSLSPGVCSDSCNFSKTCVRLVLMKKFLVALFMGSSSHHLINRTLKQVLLVRIKYFSIIKECWMVGEKSIT